MRKRERENPCGICGHYHKYEEGEICGICGHHAVQAEMPSSVHLSAFPSEILPEFLYLGSYDNASRSELLKSQGISHILNTVPACKNLYKNSFTYHCIQENSTLQLDDAIHFIEKCEREKARILVHCMSGKNRSPAYVVAYLMKSRGWRLEQSYQWVRDRRPIVEITQGLLQQLQEFEQKIFGPEASVSAPPPQLFSNLVPPVFDVGFPKPNNQAAAPAFNNPGTTSILSCPELDIPASQFTFGSGQTPVINNSNGNTVTNSIPMDSS